MRACSLFAFGFLVAGLFASVNSASAQTPGLSQVNGLGRWLGYGWSRGYHTNDGCQNSCNAPSYEPVMTYSSAPQQQFHPQQYESHMELHVPRHRNQEPTPAEKPMSLPDKMENEKDMPSVLPMPKNSAYYRSHTRSYPNLPAQNASRAWRGYSEY
jgi:hypothetical protein